MATELLDFYADWCGPCKVMEPILEEIEKEMTGKATLKKINVDSQGDLASQYGVMSIPTYIILKDGKEVERFIGSQPKQSIVTKLQDHLA